MNSADIFDWCGFFKQEQYWNTGGRTIDSSRKLWNATIEYWETANKIEKYLVKTASPARVALLFSERTAGIDYYDPGVSGGDYLSNQIGIYRALAQEHIQCEPIHAACLSKTQLEKYKVLILSNARSLTMEQISSIQDWVKDGGYIIATGESSLADRWGRAQNDYQLKELFGISYIKTKKWKQPTLFTWNNSTVTLNSGEYTQVQPTTGKVLSSWTNGIPAIVINKYGKGNSLFLSCNSPGLSYTASGHHTGRFMATARNMTFSKRLKELLSELVRKGLKACDSSTLLIADNSPAEVEMHMREQDNGNIKIIHLINHSLSNTPVHGITINLPVNAANVFYGIDNEKVETNDLYGVLRLNVRDFDVYEMIVIKLQKD